MIFPSGQEFALHLGLRDYILFAPRNSLIRANKEGIVSLPGKKDRKRRCFNLNFGFFFLGYLAIHLLGLSVGTIILLPFPSFFRRRRQKTLINKGRNIDTTANLDTTAHRQTEKTATELCSFAIIWFELFGTSSFFQCRWDVGNRGRCFEENG